jgi:hypothetical protein
VVKTVRRWRLVAVQHRVVFGTLERVKHVLAACAALSTVIEMYQSMEMTFWLPQAEMTLAQMTER